LLWVRHWGAQILFFPVGGRKRLEALVWRKKKGWETLVWRKKKGWETLVWREQA